MISLLEQTKNLLKLRGYSLKTIKSYLIYIEQYLNFSKKTGLKNIKDAIEKFLLEKVEKGQSPQTINLALNAIKFFYRETLKSNERIDIKFSKRSKKLPVVLDSKKRKFVMASIIE